MADWRGFGELLSSSFQNSYYRGMQAKQQEAQSAEQQRRTSVLEAIQKANLMMEYDQRYRPVGQEEMTPVFGAGAPFSLPPQGAVQSKSILGMFGDDSMYMPRTKPTEPKRPFTVGGDAFGYDASGNVDFSKPLYKGEATPKSKYVRTVQTEREGKYGDWGELADGKWEFIGGDKPDKPSGEGDDRYKESDITDITTILNPKKRSTLGMEYDDVTIKENKFNAYQSLKLRNLTDEAKAWLDKQESQGLIDPFTINDKIEQALKNKEISKKDAIKLLTFNKRIYGQVYKGLK